MHWLKVPVPRVQAKPNPKAGRQTGQTLLQLLHQSSIGQVYVYLDQAGAHWHNGGDKADEAGAVNIKYCSWKVARVGSKCGATYFDEHRLQTHHHDYVQALL